MAVQPFIIESPERRAHDLARLADQVRLEYFPGSNPLPIEWGKRPTRRKRRSIRLGSYHRGTTMIRIHPLLDSIDVPIFFIQSIIYHEYLHHILGPRHDRRFHRQERRFRFHAESKEWLRKNLAMLLGHRSKPRRVVLRRKLILAKTDLQLSLFDRQG